MQLRSLEIGLHLFLPIYSTTILNDRSGAFTTLETDVFKLRVMSKFYISK